MTCISITKIVFGVVSNTDVTVNITMVTSNVMVTVINPVHINKSRIIWAITNLTVHKGLLILPTIWPTSSVASLPISSFPVHHYYPNTTKIKSTHFQFSGLHRCQSAYHCNLPSSTEFLLKSWTVLGLLSPGTLLPSCERCRRHKYLSRHHITQADAARVIRNLRLLHLQSEVIPGSAVLGH